MKKKIFVGLLVLFVLGAGVLGFAAYNANAIIESYKPELEKVASDALGSTVTLGSINVTVFPGTKLVVDKVDVVSDTDERLSLANMTLKVKLLPLLQKKVVITSLVLSEPNVTLIMSEQGVHVAGLPGPEAAAAPPTDTPAPTPAAAPPVDDTPAPTAAIPEIPITLSLNEFALKNATVLVKDEILAVEYGLSGLNFSASMEFANNVATFGSLKGDGRALDGFDFSFKGSGLSYALDGGVIELTALSANALGSKTALSGTLDPNDAEKKLSIQTTGLDLATLGPVFDVFAPDMNDMKLKGTTDTDLFLALGPDGAYNAGGTVTLSSGEATVTEFTLEDMAGAVQIASNLQKQTVDAEGLKAVWSGAPMEVAMKMRLENDTAYVEPLRLGAFSGMTELALEASLLDAMPFKTSVNVSGIQAEEALAALIPDVEMQLSGTVETVTGDIQGTLDENMMPGLTGSVGLGFKDGTLKGFNLGSTVLGAVGGIPFLADTLLQAVPQELHSMLAGDETVITSLTGTFAIANEVMTTNDFLMQSSFFSLDAQGTIGFDTSLDLDSTIYFSEDFSAGLVEDTPELVYLQNDNGQIAFPVKISGVPPSLTVLPDVAELVKGAVKQGVKEEVKKGLGEKIKEQTDGLLKGLFKR